MHKVELYYGTDSYISTYIACPDEHTLLARE